MGERLPPSPSPPPPPPPPNPFWSSSPPPPLSYEVLFSETPEGLPSEPLPSIEDIEESPCVIKDWMSRCTCRVGQSYVVKWGSGVEPVEGYNMQFVREHTDITVPRLYAIYQRPLSPKANNTYLIMEYIQGESLEHLWAGLAESEKKEITAQIGKAISSLRDIPHPGYFGGIEGSILRDGMFWTEESIPSINGPFATEDNLLEGIISKYIHDCGDRMMQKANYYRRVLPKSLRGNDEPVFTHNDLQRKNVLVLPNGTISLIDWGESGWYPSYWEYASALFACGRWLDDWHMYVSETLEEYPSQYIWMNTLRIEMWS